jgi:hypothetical protein
MPARRLLALVCIVIYWITGRVMGEFYPFSPMGMFDHRVTRASRLFVRDAAGEAREIGHYDSWRCDAPLDFSFPEGCPDSGFSAYDDIVRNHIVAHPAAANDTVGREPLEITRRVFEIVDALGPVQVTDCPLLRCTARRRNPSLWTHRL